MDDAFAESILPMDDTDLAVKSNPRFPQDEHARAHTARVRERIAAEIAARGGWIPFEDYMQWALYAPGLGYYSAGARKIGAGGDFTTAPEISALFGGCLARQAAQILQALGGGSILEIGAGSGKMAADVLRRLASLGSLPDRYWILEVSADLRARR
jgi:SAM-dependent MidA family methyltransferase